MTQSGVKVWRSPNEMIGEADFLLGRYIPPDWITADILHPNLEGVEMPNFADYGDSIASKEVGLQLLYNEYICYDIAQVRLRYLFRVRMMDCY